MVSRHDARRREKAGLLFDGLPWWPGRRTIFFAFQRVENLVASRSLIHIARYGMNVSKGGAP